MKRSEIRTKIRYNIRESTAQVWADAELNYWINDVQRDVAALLDPSYNPNLIRIQTTTAVSGTVSYDLPTDYLTMIGNADCGGNIYVYAPPNMVRPLILDEYGYITSKRFFYIRQNDIFLNPTPGASEDQQGLFYSYLKTPAALADDSTTDGELSDLAYNLVVNKASSIAWSKLDSDEAQTEAKRFIEMFDHDLNQLNKSVGQK